LQNGLCIWNQHGKISKIRNSEEFWTSSGSPKGQKTPKKYPVYHLFATQEAVLAESIFGGANGLQIQKFKLFQKVDSTRFPTRYLALDLDFGKTSKIGL